MITVGIDVAKDSLVGVCIDRKATIKESFTIPNTEDSVDNLLNDFQGKYRKLFISCEATAEFHRILSLSCLRRAVPMRILNPITTHQFTRSTVRKRKTDPGDALIIAKLALQKQGTPVTYELFNPAKPALRTSAKLRQIQNQLHLMEKRLSDINADASLCDQLSGCYKYLNSSIQVFRDYALETADHALVSLLSTIPGIGPITAIVLISEIGSIKRFSSSKALVAYAGLDPKVKQSGGSLHHNTHLTKRGSPYLRRSLYISASIAQRCDPELKTYYEKKRLEGKFYKEATIAAARKLLYRVYAV